MCFDRYCISGIVDDWRIGLVFNRRSTRSGTSEVTIYCNRVPLGDLSREKANMKDTGYCTTYQNAQMEFRAYISTAGSGSDGGADLFQ